MVACSAPPQSVAGQKLEASVLIRTLPELLMSLTLPCCFTALAAIWSQPCRPPRSTSWGRALLLSGSAERSCYHHKTSCARCWALPVSRPVLQRRAGRAGEGWLVWLLLLGAASAAPSGLVLPSPLIKPSGPEASHTEEKIKLFPSGSLSARELGRA